MQTLEQIIQQLGVLPPETRDEIHKEAYKATKSFKWMPNPGPQLEAYKSLADELFFGGGAGGGKTDLVLGTALNSHRRSLILRRLNGEVAGLAERMEEILGTKKGFSSSPYPIWRLPGRLIKFGGVQHLEDRTKYQGTPNDLICVGRNTPVLMGDGSWRPVQEIAAGDMVQTLEGARRVAKAFPVGPRPSIELRVTLPEGRVVRQIQSATHKVMTPHGWISLGEDVSMAQTVPSFSPSIQSHASHKERSMPSHRFWSSWQARIAELWSGQSIGSLQEAVLSGLYRLGRLGLPSDMVQRFQETCFEASGDGRPIFSPQQISPGTQPLRPPPWAHSIASLFPNSSRLCGVYDALNVSLFADLTGRCFSCSRPYGERILSRMLDPHAGEGDQQYLPPPIDVGRPIPNDWPSDDSAQTPKYNRQSECTYVHPYTMEIRQSLASVVPSPYSVSPVGNVDLFDLEVEEVNHFITDGGIINKNCFDEVSNFLKAQYEFIIAWNRSTFPGQRVRVIATGNPPTNAEGAWVLQYWGPWLDKNHPNPALDGELRWFTTVGDNSNFEVDGPGPVVIDGVPLLDSKEKPVFPRSRTFIRAELADNPDLEETGYGSRLANLPGILRAGMLEGDFAATQEDDSMQLFPSAWVDAAFERWTPAGESIPMEAMGVDVAIGGADKFTMAPRHGPKWFGKIRSISGRDVPDGPTAAGLVFSTMRDGCEIMLDMGGGYGLTVRDHLRQIFSPSLYDGSGTADGMRDKTNTFKFHNIRAAAHWGLMEALDPVHGQFLALFPDPELKADLCAIHYSITNGKILIEPKEDIIGRIGRSPDKGDATVMAHFAKGKTNHIRVGIGGLQARATTSGRNPNRRR